VDRQLRQVPLGETGELLIGGEGVARGYLNQPALTAERFIPNPFGSDKSDRLYKTGDLCRFWHDGAIECLGRNDNQVKIRGYRVELGDVEAALESHPGVNQAAAKVVDGPGGVKALVGYVVAAEVEEHELRAYLANRLPEYMVPSTYIKLRELPLTPNRKIDRKALPVPDDRDTPHHDRYISPRTDLEMSLSEIVATLLGLERVGTHDNFFLVGGHSLFCTQLAARIRNKFGVDLPVRSIFESPTAAQVAQHIESTMTARICSMTADEVQKALQESSYGGGQK
jgi:acyl carrier protein